MGLLLATNINKQPLLPLIEQALGSLFNNPTDGFYTGRVMDMLFDGVPIHCPPEDQVATTMCYHFQGESSFKKLDAHHYTFSLFGGVSICIS